MKFNVLNIAEFHKKGEGDGEGLIEFICDFKPTVLMLSWCFSTTCDLAMLLRREGVFGTMFATFDLRTITGDPTAELSDQQKEVLEKNREVKDVVLAGPYGVGKTILLCELAKAAMAEKGWETAKVRIFHGESAGCRKLVEYLKETFKPVGHREMKVGVWHGMRDEFPGDDSLLVDIGKKMEEEKTRLIIVGDEMLECHLGNHCLYDEKLAGFQHTKFLYALAAHIEPHERELKSFPHIFKLRSQYRNTEKILAFMHFQWEFCNEVRKTTGNPDYTLRKIVKKQVDPGETQQSLPKPLPSSPHPVVWLPLPNLQYPMEMLVRETLKAMKCILQTGDQHLNVVVLDFFAEDMIASMARRKICEAGERELGTFTWEHSEAINYRGREAPVVILLVDDHLPMEYFSRARNQLVIVTIGRKLELTEEFYSKYEQRRSKYSFDPEVGLEVVGDIRDMLQLSADLGKLQKMGEDKRIFQTEF
jgi:hypothetical protein